MVLLRALLLVATLCLCQGAPPAPGPTLPPGQVKCGSKTCDFYQECKDDKICAAKGNEECKRESNGGTLVAYCEPHQSCCDGLCCNWDQACITAGYSSANTYSIPGTTPISVTLDKLARNDWILPTGGELNDKPKICSSVQVMSPMMGVNGIAIPMFSLIFIIVIMLLSIKNFGMSPMGVRAPAALLFFFSIFLLFSTAWKFAYLGCLTAALTFAAPDHKQGHLIFWLVFSLFMYWGGFEQMRITGNNFMTSSPSTTACETFYGNYFKYSNQNRDYTTSPSRTTWGYCSIEWLIGVQTFNFFCVLCNFLMLIFTVQEYGQK